MRNAHYVSNSAVNLTLLSRRVFETISYSGPAGTGRAIGGEAVRRWNGQAQ